MVCGINIQEIEHGIILNNDSDILGNVKLSSQ